MCVFPKGNRKKLKFLKVPPLLALRRAVKEKDISAEVEFLGLDTGQDKLPLDDND